MVLLMGRCAVTRNGSGLDKHDGMGWGSRTGEGRSGLAPLSTRGITQHSCLAACSTGALPAGSCLPALLCLPACLFACTGVMRGHISQSEPGQLLLNMDWDQPVQGSGVDLFTPEEGGLVVQSSVTIGGVTQRFRSVYSRG